MSRSWSFSAAGVFALAFASTPAFAEVTDNPGYDRPGMGFTPAVLHAGDVIFEQGLPDFSRNDDVTVYDADSLLRVGLGHDLELQLGTGWRRIDSPSFDEDGRVDTSLGLKYAPEARGNFSWGLLGSVELTDGARAFRGGDRQYLLGVSLGWQLADDFGVGLYAETVRGDADSELVAVNAGWTLTPDVGAYVELGGQHVTDTGSGALAGAGITWQITSRIQLDLSLRRGLSDKVDDWQGSAGFAIYFGD